MPMNRKLYPKNWKTIAFIVKGLAGWKCQQCGRPCLKKSFHKPDQDWFDFVNELLKTGQKGWYEQTYKEVYSPETGERCCVEKPGRFRLTTAHLNHDPENPEPHLKALCPQCHNIHDAKHRAVNAKRTRHKQKHQGQLELWN